MFSSVESIEIQEEIDLYQAKEPESDYDFFHSGRSPNSVKQNWDKLVIASLEKAGRVNPWSVDLPAGTVVPAVEAVNWSGTGDIRPRLWDKSSGQFRLIDSGSMITATKRQSSSVTTHYLREKVMANGKFSSQNFFYPKSFKSKVAGQ